MTERVNQYYQLPVSRPLLNHMREELADAEAYEQMAEQHTEWSGVFRDMAHDERSHAKMLKHLMDVLGVQEK